MNDQTSLLQGAINEIRQLRNQNQIMGARLQMFDDMMLLLRTPPNIPGRGCSPDIIYDLEKQIEYQKAKLDEKNNKED